MVAFDNSQFASELEEKRLTASQAGSDLETAQAQLKTSDAERQFNVEKARSELEKAKLSASIPKDLLALREYQERQLALKRAETELAKAEEVLHHRGEGERLGRRRSRRSRWTSRGGRSTPPRRRSTPSA